MNRMKCLLIWVCCVVISGCGSSSDYSVSSYDEGYREGYRNGKEDASYDASNMDFDAAESYIESDEWCMVVETVDYASTAGHCAGVFAYYPMSDSAWIDNRDNGLFSDIYMDCYFDVYNYFSEISYDEEFNYSVIEMIDTSSLSDAILEVGYDEWHEVALIRWSQGSLYAYENVKRNDFEGLITADSIGTYANQHFKGKYSYYEIIE